ncbi:hypothetical protein P5V15_001019 [Pogonomyrmex californicus]
MPKNFRQLSLRQQNRRLEAYEKKERQLIVYKSIVKVNLQSLADTKTQQPVMINKIDNKLDKQEKQETVRGDSARPRILSDITFRPSTSKSNHFVYQPLFDIQNNENKENNMDKESIELEHTVCCEKCRRGYYTKFATIERKLNKIIHFLENKNERNEIQEVDFSLLPNFPLSTVQQIDNFNNRLKDANVRRLFMVKMSQLGGETVSKLVRNIMFQIFGYELAQAYSWTGQKKNKSAFRKSKLADTIIVLKKNSNTTVTEVEGCMQEWLRRSGDRLRILQK